MTSPAMTKLGLTLMNASQPDVEAPLPGVYPGIPMLTYHRWPGASNSRLTKIRQSPAHLKAYMEESVDALHFKIGRAAHSAILEPDDFARNYVIAQRCTAITQKKTQCSNSGNVYANGEWFCGTHSGGFAGDHSAVVLNAHDHAAILKMRDAVYAHPKARKLLSGKGMAELSAIWNDKVNGVLCRARFDRFAPDFAAIVDVKTTMNASKDAFARTIHSYGYHRQAALYLAGAEATGLQARHFVNVVVEKERPYAVAAYEMDEGSLDAGLLTLRPLLDLYKHCIETDTWPGYSDDIEPIAIPSYAFQQADTEAREAARV